MASKEGQQIDTLPVQAYGLDGATIRKLSVDENGKVIVDPTGLDARYLKLDQTTPQTVTGLSDGFLKLTSGVVGTGTIDTSALVSKTDLKTIKVDGDFYGLYRVSATKKISPPDLGFGYTITNVKVQCASADPTTEFSGDLKLCDSQGTGAFPSTNPTVIKVLDTTTGNYDSGAITEDVATDKELYIQMDSATDYGVMWTITITYTLKTS